MLINELKGANMDIDFSNPEFGNSKCSWNESENTTEHKCAVKYTSICKYFCGIKYMDSVICSYPYENSDVLKEYAPVELILGTPNSVTASAIAEEVSLLPRLRQGCIFSSRLQL